MEPPPALPGVELLDGIEAPVSGAGGPCPEWAAGGCWSGAAVASVLRALDDLARYARDAWDVCRDRRELTE